MTASIRVRCRLGGPVPCIDDMCHGVSQTVCGLERGYDFCDHGYDPDSCQACADEDREDYPEDDGYADEVAT